jgi:hypothetical protein
MTIERNIAVLNLVDVQTQAADMVSALRTLKPNAQHRKSQLFSMLYPVIVELLENNVTQKAILELLQTKGLKLHPARFKELMAAEASAQPATTAGRFEPTQTDNDIEENV